MGTEQWGSIPVFTVTLDEEILNTFFPGKCSVLVTRKLVFRPVAMELSRLLSKAGFINKMCSELKYDTFKIAWIGD